MKATLDRWTCDRCGDVTEEPTGKQPEGWTGVDHTAPPLAEPRNGSRRHLCPACSGIVETALTPTT